MKPQIDGIPYRLTKYELHQARANIRFIYLRIAHFSPILSISKNRRLVANVSKNVENMKRKRQISETSYEESNMEELLEEIMFMYVKVIFKRFSEYREVIPPTKWRAG